MVKIRKKRGIRGMYYSLCAEADFREEPKASSPTHYRITLRGLGEDGETEVEVEIRRDKNGNALIRVISNKPENVKVEVEEDIVF